jgi:glycolate dehydrogenase FAD-binding subunit
MKLSKDQLAQRLASELGSDAVSGELPALAEHAVDGIEPALLCLPEAPSQIAAALRICSEADAAVTPWGHGSAMVIGNRPRRIDVIIALHRLNRLLEHDHANLTATVEAGMPVTALQESLAGHNQFLAVDPPFPGTATIAGVVAANLNGTRRMFYGSVRDLVIGVKVVLASGEQIKGGGKVVKNVAGYDMCKLFVGSLGTLGIITEVTLRMAPIPETAATLVVFGALGDVRSLVEQLSRSALIPARVVFLNHEASNLTRLSREEWAVAVSAEGFEETVARHLSDVGGIAAKLNLGTQVLRDDAHNRFWDEIRDLPLRTNALVYRFGAPQASVAELASAVQADHSAEFSPQIVADALAGTMWVASAAKGSDAERFSKFTTLARQHSGHIVMLAAPPILKQNVDVWGTPPDALSIMREIKRQFDPNNLLNPGRFVAAI